MPDPSSLLSRTRRRAASGVFVAGVALSIAACTYTQHVADERRDAAFAADAELAARLIEARIEGQARVLRGLRDALPAVGAVPWPELAPLANAVRAADPSVLAMRFERAAGVEPAREALAAGTFDLRIALHGAESPAGATDEQRRALPTSLSLTLQAEPLIEQALGTALAQRLRLRIHDVGPSQQPSTVAAIAPRQAALFDSAASAASAAPAAPVAPAAAAASGASAVPGRGGSAEANAFHRAERMRAADRLWQLDVAPTRAPAGAAGDRALPWAVLAAGLLGSALVAGLLRASNRSRGRARVHAANLKRRLVASDERFRALVADSQDCVAICAPDGVIRYASAPVESLLGMRAGEVLGRNLLDLVHEDDQPGVRDAMAQARAHPGTGVGLTQRVRAGDGSWRTLESVLRDLTGQPGIDGLVVHCKDVSAREQVSAELARSEERLQIAINASGVSFWDFDVPNARLHLSEQWARLLGDPEGPIESSAEAWLARTHPDEQASLMQVLALALKGVSSTYRFDHRVRCADGRWLWVESVGRVIERDAEGRALRMAGTNMDITERKRAEERIEELAYRDVLTGLPNRLLLADRVAQAITQAGHHGDRVALLFIDLDQFKRINDSLGQDAGDRLLQAAAGRLAAGLREGDTLARYGGDEFVVALPAIADAAFASAMAQQVLDTLAVPIAVGSQKLRVGASIGIAMYPEDGRDAATLVHNADTAMSHAKTAGRGQIHFFQPDMTQRARRRLQLERDLHHALERNELALAYQPLIDADSGRIVGAEALLRWQHGTVGEITPSEFIPIAEECGLIVPLGEWVLDRACMQARQWQRDANPRFSIAVNLSARQAMQADLPEVVERALAHSQLARGTLELEITEGHLMQSDEATLATLQRLRSGAGALLVVDDFGTGYSSLGYLRRLPIDKLKIDRSFVGDLATRPEDRALVAGIVSIARALDLGVTVEGIETREQFDRVHALGCGTVQGFLVGRPMPAKEFSLLFATERAQVALPM